MGPWSVSFSRRLVPGQTRAGGTSANEPGTGQPPGLASGHRHPCPGLGCFFLHGHLILSNRRSAANHCCFSSSWDVSGSLPCRVLSFFSPHTWQETEAQNGQYTCPGWHRCGAAEVGCVDVEGGGEGAAAVGQCQAAQQETMGQELCGQARPACVGIGDWRKDAGRSLEGRGASPRVGL